MSRQKANTLDDIVSAIQLIDLDESKKKIIIYRYTAVLREYRARSTRYSFAFHTLRITITVGSLIVPALLSVQGGAMSTIVYWCVWVLSLCVTISNGVMTLFKVDKQYYTMNTTFHHLVSEGWQYIELTGRYNGIKTPGMPVTHETQFKVFCRSLEKTRMKQVEDEYFRVPELKDVPPSSGAQQFSPDIFTSLDAPRLAISPRADPFQYSQNPPPPLNGGGSTVVRLQAAPSRVVQEDEPITPPAGRPQAAHAAPPAAHAAPPPSSPTPPQTSPNVAD